MDGNSCQKSGNFRAPEGSRSISALGKTDPLFIGGSEELKAEQLPIADSSSASRLGARVVTDPLAPANSSPEAIAARLRLLLQLSDEGLAMKLASLRRHNPEASEADLRAQLEAWLRDADPPGCVEGWTVVNRNRFAI